MVTLRGIDFGDVFSAPGATGFFGEGYKWHAVAKRFGYTLDGTTPVFKTTTLSKNLGNMPLARDGMTPKELRPKCIVWKPRSGHTLNAVGLSGPGAYSLMQRREWQNIHRPFIISFMPIGDASTHLDQLKAFCELLADELPGFGSGSICLQINVACPNTGHPPDELFALIPAMLDEAGKLGIPITLNFSPVAPLGVLKSASEHEACDGLWITNTIPWGDPRIDWRKIFGTRTSPLTKFKNSQGVQFPGGGLSGPACLPLAIGAVIQARQAGITKPIVVGNGIQHVNDVLRCYDAGASAISIGTVGMHRPWNMSAIIMTAKVVRPYFA